MAYLYSIFVCYNKTGKPPFRALVCDYTNDTVTYDIDDDGNVSFIDDGKYIYLEGRRMEADEDLKYEPFTAFGAEVKTGDDVTDGNFYLVNTSGSIQKRRHNLKDRDGNYYCTNDNGVITYYGGEKCENHNDDAKHE